VLKKRKPSGRICSFFTMTQQKKNSETNAAGIIPMAAIDGTKIRRLREEKGLTQLYLSTVVGVTTDTISRWENRRYPSIKLENAKKLARALQVELDAILEDESAVSGGGTSRDMVPKKKERPTVSRIIPFRARWPVIAGMALLLVFLAWGFLRQKPVLPVITAERILPPHVPPGQSFPVLIRVVSSSTTPVSLILKEIVPPACTVQRGIPPFTAVGPGKNILKWISKTMADETVFTYMVQAPKNARSQEKLSFAGHVTLKQGSGNQGDISGSSTLSIDEYHWADTNRDNRIDDEEILVVYDRFSEIPELPVNIDLIDDIWAGRGYSWDREKMIYVLKE
jgi:transcriptional regulator with XRE-family HTH domain